MPLLEMKSNLSKINTNFGSDTTTAGKNSGLETQLRDATPPDPWGGPINFSRYNPLNFNNTPIANLTSAYALPILPETISTTIQSQTQQESGNLFGGGIPPVNIELPIYYPNAPTNPNKKYVDFVNSKQKDPSPIQVLHNNESRLINNFPLAEYYAQGKGSGELGMRKSTRFFTQPYVIKDVGDRWGFGGVEQFATNNTVAKIIDFAGLVINDIGGAVLGRSPNEYVGNAIGNLERNGQFLLTGKGVAFLTKQAILQRRNAQKLRTDVRYGLDKSEASKFINPRVYNPISLASLPGVTKISINTFDITMPFDVLKDTIAGYVSEKVMNLATTVKGTITKFISDVSSEAKLALLEIPGIGATADFIKTQEKEIRDKTDAFKEVLGIEDGAISKLTGIKINNEAFADVGKDRVNLIPYGSRIKKSADKTIGYAQYKGKTEEELDFIPFRFEDNNGKLMVFRAILSGISDTFTPEYSEERYVGRPDKVYVYQGTNRELSFTFDVYPKSDEELIVLWEKLNYLAGLTYPEWVEANGGGLGMKAPFCKLTIGQMYKNTTGYISGLTYTVMDEGTWETHFAKLPKYIQVSCNFIYIGNRLPSSTQKHFELPWVGEEKTTQEILGNVFDQGAEYTKNAINGALRNDKKTKKSIDNILGLR